MANRKRSISAATLRKQVVARLADPVLLYRWLGDLMPWIIGPSITSFDPPSGHPGCLVDIEGHQFSTVRGDNTVEIGNRPALVVAASPTHLRVLTDPEVSDGPVTVKVGTRTATGPHDFGVLGYPDPGAGEDGPPIAFEGAGAGSPGDVNPIGTIRVLVSLVRPSDLTPANAVTARQAVVDAWTSVQTYYTQASYGRTNVQIDVTAGWAALDGTQADFVVGDNIPNGMLARVTAQAAQAAVNEGFALNDYAMMASVLFLNGTFIRAWGGWSQQNFTYNNGLPVGNPNRVDINLTANHDINLLAIGESADWGRFAHEFGHNIVSAPTFTGDGTATLGEDIYSSDLVDPLAAGARDFDLMGSHDSHPLFTGYHMEKLGYYAPANIAQATWNCNPFSQQYDVVAHGLAEDTTANRVHLVKIKVSDGLFYYVQVRQRPGATAQVFDSSIPLDGAANQGGVIVTRVISDTLQINQQTRFISLLHDDHVLRQGVFADDPARTIRITVLNDNVVARPQVCTVRVEWAQTIADDPNGSFDLRVEPWDGTYTTPDIWVDRAPFGTYDNPNDAEGRPTGNGDRPRVGQINQLHARVHVSGAMGASSVLTTLYAVFPPGVGDNGNWAPLSSQTVAAIAQNGFADVIANWVPVVGQHTCLKVYASQQLGEISGGNNSAQENVADFNAAGGSPVDPVFIPTAIRNPLDERRLVQVAVRGVPEGYRVYFPHQWIWLDAKAERTFELVVVPFRDYGEYQERKLVMNANIKIDGALGREYAEPLDPFGEPAGSRFYPIGGVLNRVHIRRHTDIDLREDREASHSDEWTIGLRGNIQPAAGRQRVRVELTDPKGDRRVAEVGTELDGSYRAAFDLRYGASLQADPGEWPKAEELLKGTYRAQAFIFAADVSADAESNLEYVTR